MSTDGNHAYTYSYFGCQTNVTHAEISIMHGDCGCGGRDGAGLDGTPAGRPALRLDE